MTMDRGVNRSSGKDGAQMIVVSWWNANFGDMFTQASPGA
jgi:hypothetical protein